MKKTIGDFLLDRLSQIGINTIFGVPGDYNLQFLMQAEKRKDIKFVGNRNELNAAYTADGYARLNGISAILTTYGVGDLSALNGVAGAYAEYVPMVCLSGAPPLHSINQRSFLHHTTAEGNYEDVMNCYRSYTVAQARLTPQNAVGEIDRVLQVCKREKRPVYIQIPSDITFFEIDVPDEKLVCSLQMSDSLQLSNLLHGIKERLRHAERPAMLLGNAIDRFGLRELTQELIEKLNIPFATQSAAQAILDQGLLQWVGEYNGGASVRSVLDIIENSDCLIGINVKFTDSNSGYFTQNIPENMINIMPFSTIVGKKVFEDVCAVDLLKSLIKNDLSRQSNLFSSIHKNKKHSWTVEKGKALILNRFWTKMDHFIQENDVIVTDAGTSMRGVRGLALPAGITIINQPLWLSIGYSLPALFGSLMAAPKRRQILFIGDGSFQLTAQEVSAFFAHDLNPIIFLVNNKGYTIERSIMGLYSSFNDIPEWNYHKLFDALSDNKPYSYYQVRTEDELETSLEELENDTLVPRIVEIMIDPFDIPKKVQDSADRIASFNYGKRGLKELDKKVHF